MRGKTVRGWVLGSACLLLLVMLFVSFSQVDYEEELLRHLKFTYADEEKSIDLSLWRDEDDGRFYLFLPSWLSEKEALLEVSYGEFPGRIVIDEKIYPDGSMWRDDGTESLHALEICGVFGESHSDTTIQVLASANLPSLFVTVEDRENILTTEEFDKKKYLETGSMILTDTDGTVLCESDLSVFKVRGNLTAEYDKKPFTFTLKEPQSILGMEPAVKWNLLANSTDGAYIRNKIMRDLAYESIQAYEPEGEFAELYLNGEYQGLYLLTEAVEIGTNRIEIEPEDNWFVEMELDFRAREDETQMITDRGQIFIIQSEKVITQSQKAQILERLNDVESALFAEDGVSTLSGKSLEQLIDLESFAEAWLMEEISGDHDIGITSQFLYALKEEDSLWYSGPAWDFDGIMTNVNTPMYAIPEALTGCIEMSRPEGNKNQNRWLAAMWRHEAFRQIVEEKYSNIFREKSYRILEEDIDAHVETIRRSAQLDAFKWHDKRLGWFFTIPEKLHIPEDGGYERWDTLDVSIEVVKDFMARKLQFLDKLWMENREFCVVEIRNSAPFLNQGYNQTLYYWVEKGTPIQNLPHYETEEYPFEGYYDKDSDELITDGFIIEYHRIIEGRWTGWDGEW